MDDGVSGRRDAERVGRRCVDTARRPLSTVNVEASGSCATHVTVLCIACIRRADGTDGTTVYTCSTILCIEKSFPQESLKVRIAATKGFLFVSRVTTRHTQCDLFKAIHCRSCLYCFFYSVFCLSSSTGFRIRFMQLCEDPCEHAVVSTVSVCELVVN